MLKIFNFYLATVITCRVCGVSQKEISHVCILKGDQQHRVFQAQGFAKLAPNCRILTTLGMQGSLVC